MNRIIVYGLIGFLAWQGYEQYKAGQAQPAATPGASPEAPPAATPGQAPPASPAPPRSGGY